MTAVTAQLQEFCRIVQGGRSGLSGNDFVPEGFPAYGAGGVNGFLPNCEFNEPAVVLSAIGARCGKCFYAEGKWVSLVNTQLIFPNPARADAKFLWYQLNDERRWHRSGTGQPFIKPADVKTHRVFLPRISDQRRIAGILDKVSTLLVKRRATIAEIDTVTESVFLDMFGDATGNPKGWPQKRLQEIVKTGTIVTYGIVQAGDEFPGGVPYIRTGDIVDGEIVRDGLRHTDPALAAKFARSEVQAGEIVMSIRAIVGTTALVPSDLVGANLTQGTARIAPGDGVEGLYLLQFLRAQGTQHWVSRQIKGATFREITLTRLRELPVMVPPMGLQKEFVRRVNVMGKLKASLRSSLSNLDDLFGSLHHRAFRGDL